MLIDAGFSISAVTSTGDNILHLLFSRPHLHPSLLDVVPALMSQDSAQSLLLQHNNHGYTPFACLFMIKNCGAQLIIKQAKLLLSINKTNQNLFDFKCPVSSSNLLHISVSFGQNADIVHFLCKLGVNHCEKNNRGRTPLFCVTTRQAAVALLKYYKPDEINIKDYNGQTALTVIQTSRLYLDDVMGVLRMHGATK